MNHFLLFYGWMQIAFFGLLLGLAAESAKSWKQIVFLWLLALGWPVIVAWKLLCKQEVKP